MRFISTIIHFVENLTVASEFLCQQLDFYQKDANENDCLLENGAVSLRLIKKKPPFQNFLNLELETNQLDEETAHLLAIKNVSLLSEKNRVNPYRLETQLQAPHQFIITVFKSFDEDELGIIPPLPISLDWDEDTMVCIQHLLKQVPIHFREMARKRVTERAEVLAAEQGLISVEENQALNALADVVPSFQQPVLAEALRERGIDPEPYFPENNSQS